MKDNFNSDNSSVLTRFFNKFLFYNYKRGEILFKILYDKYFRREIYNEINSVPLTLLRKSKENYHEKLITNINWVNKNKLNELRIDEDIEDVDTLEIENKSIDYLKKNITGIKMQAVSCAFSALILLAFLIFYPNKRIRKNVRIKVIYYFSLISIISFNTYLLATIVIYNSISKKFLEEAYKRQLERYNLILN